MASEQLSSLWRHADFLKLWLGQTISQIGSQVSFLALPLVATVLLDATPFQMGLLTAASSLPTLLVGLFAGVFVDRHRRRPVLMASDLGRALLFGLVPLAWMAGRLSVELLYVVALLAGMLSLFFDVAYQAFLPQLVPRDKLTDANGKSALGGTAAQLAGPSLAGWLIHLLSAPMAIAADAVSYLVSAAMLARVRTVEPSPVPATGRSGVRSEASEGVRIIFRDPRLLALAGSRSQLALFNAMLEAVFILYVVRVLGVGSALLGFIFSIGSAGFVAGALLPTRLSRRYGVGVATVGGMMLVGLSDLLVPLAGGSRLVVIPLLVTAEFGFGLGLTIFNINQVSLRQTIIPLRLQGRATATIRVLLAGFVPLGAILGGLAGELIGLRTTLIAAALGELLAAPWIWRSPLRSLHELPQEDLTEIT